MTTTTGKTIRSAASSSNNETRNGSVVARRARTGTTKKVQLIQMLSRKAGADVATISEKLGWLPHTTRAALSGLRKSGYEITPERSSNGKPSRYRIIAKPQQGAS